MAESRRYALNAQLDIEQILQEAQHRWLRPAEICAILQNHAKFRISPEPPNRPPSGSLFLFDRKVLRYFRKDGHNWRKKKDGKTVKEAHERLKSGSIDVLHCYYAHGEEDEHFQRRSYWMLEEVLSHIVLVHYREVKGSRTSFNRIRESDLIPDGRQTEPAMSNSEVDSYSVSRFQHYDQRASQFTTSSLHSTQASEYEDAESAYRRQASPGSQSTHELQSPVMQKMEAASVPYYLAPSLQDSYKGQFSASPDMSFGSVTQGGKDKIRLDNGLTYELHQDLGFQSWENLVESSSSGHRSSTFQPSLPSSQPCTMSMMGGQENEFLGQVPVGTFGNSGQFERHSNGMEQWQASNHGSDTLQWPVDKIPDGNLNLVEKVNQPPSREPLFYDLSTEVNDANQGVGNSAGFCTAYPTEQFEYTMQNNYQMPASIGTGSTLKAESAVNPVEDKTCYPTLKQPLLDGVMKEGLKKLDSFDRWMSKELGDMAEPNTQSGLGVYWDDVRSEDGVNDSGIRNEVPLDNYVLSPALSQDQFFTVLDFSPNWAYSGSEIKVLITGKFLKSREEVEKHNWACMFGELEVPAEIVANGVIRCHTPLHEAGRVPFYVTCSNRLACSEVREFEFRSGAIQDENIPDVGSIGSDETLLHMRFGKLLTLKPGSPESSSERNVAETSYMCSKINELLKDDTEWEQMLNLTRQDDFSADKVKDQLLQKLLKEKLQAWLLQKVTEGGKGPSVLDDGGQGVLHFAAALSYDWAIPPTITAGVSVNFRDVNGWTALHWAAYYGREHTVAFLISLGANPGALTDPTPRYPGRTPAALASSNGHKGISGYLSECELTSQLSTLNLKDSKNNNSKVKAVETSSERVATPLRDGDLPQGLSMKDSLAALRNATQAAARIHQVFRVQSFQRKQLKEYGDRELGLSDERALSRIALKTNKAGQRDEPVHAAAIRIQNKFRGWKGRKEFLLTRQRIIKIQAHVRGHQVRKNYKKIIWSVGILDKVILRWRRKGRGLSGFRPEADAGTSMQGPEIKEDDYDFLKEGRKQTEERLNKALARVKSMVQYPEARDQYRRLLNVVTEMQETKAQQDMALIDTGIDFDDDLIDLEALLEDDTFMSTS